MLQWYINKYQAEAAHVINFIKIEVWHRCFSLTFSKFLRASIFAEHLQKAASVSTTECFQPCHKSSHYHLFCSYKTIDKVIELLIYPKFALSLIHKIFLLAIFFCFYFFGLFSWLSILHYTYLLTILSEQDLCTVSTKSSITNYLEVMYE